MSIARLSAGEGYRYLTRSVACDDVPRGGATDLTGYYAASGNPPGIWYGSGLAGLGDDRSRLRAGDRVSEEQMARFFGAGLDPVTGAALGRAYPVFAPVSERVARRVAALPDGMDPRQRAALVADIERQETSRSPKAVAGFDLTFSARKSVSVLWALGDEATRQRVYAAHRAALADVLAYAERAAVFTRVGAGGVAQLPVRGMVAAAFDHWDTRTGDPQLHTHVVIANKVQGHDGVWRSLDSRALHHAVVTLSELYDNLLADQLSAVLPVRFSVRSRGARRSTGFEVDGIDDDVLGVFSTRTRDINAAFAGLVRSFTAQHGRGPSRVEVTRLRQVATLASRPVKRGRRLADLLREWRGRVRTVLGRDPDAVVAAALTGARVRPLRHDQVTAHAVDGLAAVTLDRVSQRAATFSTWQIRAEVHRVTRALRLASAADRIALADRVMSRVEQLAVPLTPEDPVDAAAAVGEFARPGGGSAFTRAGMGLFTHPELLAAETRLLATHLDDVDAPTVDAAVAGQVAAGARQPRSRDDQPVHLAGDQVAAVVAVCASGRRIDVLVGPAGTGKTTTLQAVRDAWERVHGRGSVIGLAPSATAAHELGHAMNVMCENTAKWLHEADGLPARRRAAVRDGLLAHRHQLLATRPDPAAVAEVERRLRRVDAEAVRWRLHPGQLVIVDEASLAGTRTLDALRGHAVAAGAKLLLVGDHHQLDAVDAGGGFALLADRGQPRQLVSLWRFRRRWEAHATRALRRGDPAAIDAYAARGRIHGDDLDGQRDLVLDHAYTAWQTDTDAGRASLLVAADTDTVAALNARAHADRVATGQVTGPLVDLGDAGCGGDRGSVGAGDLILTRRNDRSLSLPDGGHVRNGALFRVTAVHPDGSLSVTPTSRDHHDTDRDTGERVDSRSVQLPAQYVAEHVDPGYATTAHRAQGVTVDTAHVLACPGMTREALYVAMTRGRDANHVHVTTDPTDTDCATPAAAAAVPDAVAVLRGILARSGRAPSATQTLADAADRLTGHHRLTQIRATPTTARDASLGPEAETYAAALQRLDQLTQQRRTILTSTAAEPDPAAQHDPDRGRVAAPPRRVETTEYHTGRSITE